MARTKVTASCELGGPGGLKLTDIPVINPGDCYGKAWLLEIGLGYSSVYFVVEADSVSDAIDIFSDSHHGHHIHVTEPDLADYDSETCHHDDQGRVIDTDNLLVHGEDHYGKYLPIPSMLYHVSEPINPLEFGEWSN